MAKNNATSGINKQFIFSEIAFQSQGYSETEQLQKWECKREFVQNQNWLDENPLPDCCNGSCWTYIGYEFFESLERSQKWTCQIKVEA